MMVWSLENRSRDGNTMSGETEKLKPKESHKNDKLDTATFKLTGQKLHASGPEPTKNKQVNSAAAAKSLQLCPTLCDPIDGSPPGSPVPGILQARTLEWVAISFSNA